MDMAIETIVVALVAIGIYVIAKALKAIGRVGFLNFSKALLTLLTSFVVISFKVVGSVFNRGPQERENVNRNPDPFLSPMEKSPTAQSPLIENPIDNPEGYYRGD